MKIAVHQLLFQVTAFQKIDIYGKKTALVKIFALSQKLKQQIIEQTKNTWGAKVSASSNLARDFRIQILFSVLFSFRKFMLFF